MRLPLFLLVLLASVSLLVPRSLAQAGGDPSDRFLSAYTAYQKGEKLESTSNFAAAMAAYKEAGQALDGVAASAPTWNPTIVEYRRKKIAEAITRIQPKVTAGGNAAPPDLPILPRSDVSGGVADEGGTEPILTDTTRPDAPPRGRRPKNSATPPAVPEDPIAQIQARMKTLQEDLKTSTEERDKARHEREELQAKLAQSEKARTKTDDQIKLLQQRSDTAERALMEARSKGTADSEAVKVLKDQRDKLRKDLRDLKIDADAEAEVRQQVSQRLESTVKNAAALRTQRDDAAQAGQAAKLASDAAIAAEHRRADEAEKRATAAIADVQKRLDAALKERDTLVAKLTATSQERDAALAQVTQLKDAQKNVDKLVADNTQLMAKLASAEKQITQFKADSQQKDLVIADLKKEVGSVKAQLATAQKESAAYQTQMAELQGKLDGTAKQLAQMKTDATATTAERKRMGDENELLRGIVLRQMKEQARRDQTRKLVLDEMSRMDVKSKELLARISYLGQPVVKLTPKELSLFKKPQVEISSNEVAISAPRDGEATPGTELALPESVPAPPADATSPAVAASNPTSLTPPKPPEHLAGPMEATPKPADKRGDKPGGKRAEKVAEKQPEKLPEKAAPRPDTTSTPLPSKGQLANVDQSKPAPAQEFPDISMLDTSRLNKPAKPAESTNGNGNGNGNADALRDHAPPASGGSAVDASGVSSVPSDLQPVAADAKDQFEKGNFRRAEELYAKILLKAPNNLYALSNMGVVRFKEGKLALAEEAFRKSIAIAPEDAFSHCTLGIIFYTRERYDEAVTELTKALAINPKYAAAHNFLGITASQKGWVEAAQKELETATALDPNYADAHFNLAVVLATQQPPNKEKARLCYKRATQLGAESDRSLEDLLK